MKKGMRIISLLLAFLFIINTSASAATLVKVENDLSLEEYSVISTPDKYLGLDLYSKSFDRNLMNELEEEYFDYLLDQAAQGNSDQIEEIETILISDDITELIEKDSYYSAHSTLSSKSAAPWWHLNTVNNVGNAIDVIISAALGSLGAKTVRSLIYKMGESQAKKLIKSNVIMKVKSTLIRWGMHQGAKTVERYGLALIMRTITFSPGLQIAKLIDSRDKRPNSGRIEFW